MTLRSFSPWPRQRCATDGSGLHGVGQPFGGPSLQISKSSLGIGRRREGNENALARRRIAPIGGAVDRHEDVCLRKVSRFATARNGKWCEHEMSRDTIFGV